MSDFREIVSFAGVDQDTVSKIVALLKEANDLKPESKNISQVATLLREKLGIDQDDSLRLSVSVQEEEQKHELQRKIEMKLREAALLLVRAKPSLNVFTALRQICQAFKRGSSLEYKYLSFIEEVIKYPRDIDLALLELDKYKGTENYFTCSFTPGYDKEPLKHFAHVLHFAGTDALSALNYAQNYGGRLYGLLLQKLVVSDKSWPEEEPVPAESCTLRPGDYVIIVPSVEVKAASAVQPTLLVLISAVHNTFDMASWALEKVVPYRAMLAKIFAVINEDGGWETKGVKRLGGEFAFL